MTLPWENGDSAAAQGFTRAFARLDATSEGAAVKENSLANQALIISGTDTDARELATYHRALAAAYTEQVEQDEAIRASTDRGFIHAQVLRHLQGLAMTAWLAGRLAADVGDRRDASVSSPLADLTRPGELEASGTAEQDWFLSLAWVFGLEADRAAAFAGQLKVMGSPMWELFDGVARELRDYIEQHP